MATVMALGGLALVAPDSVGAYVVYAPGAHDGARPLYVGKAGTQVARRWREQHLRDRAGGSALRRALGVHLHLVEQKLKRPNRYYPSDVEREITAFIERCGVVFYRAATAADASTLKAKLIHELDPILNAVRG
jgi:hypothetical protein